MEAIDKAKIIEGIDKDIANAILVYAKLKEESQVEDCQKTDDLI